MSYYNADHVRNRASGNWLLILGELAPDLEPALKKKRGHVSCPVHQGKDGFRLFKDAHRTGGGICSTCGPRHDGFELLMWINRWSFKECLKEVGDLLGCEKSGNKEPSVRLAHKNAAPQPAAHSVQSGQVKQITSSSIGEAQDDKDNVVPLFKGTHRPWLIERQIEMEKRLEREKKYSAQLYEKIVKVWNECVPITSEITGPMRLYFKSRGLFFKAEKVMESDSIRFNPNMSYYDEDGNLVGKFPAIVCAIRDVNGTLVTLHRTYLTEGGTKAVLEDPKKMMPVPDGMDVNGASIRLGEPTEGILGVAEGLETALSAYRATQIPVWSTVNATLMGSFQIPEGVHTVLIWADKDRSGAGEQYANILKAKVLASGRNAFIVMPRMAIPPKAKGVDWNDVLMSDGIIGFPNARQIREYVEKMRAQYASI